MDETEIKSELITKGENISHVQNDEKQDEVGRSSVQSSDTRISTRPSKKKLKVEIQLKLENEDMVNELKDKVRARKTVVRYEDKKTLKKEASDREKKIKFITGEKVFTCETCKLLFQTIQALIMHRKTHLRVFKITCAICSEKFDTNTALIEHKIVHKDEDRNFLCMKCKAAFTDHLEYQLHKLTHQTLQVYNCMECGKQCKKKEAFKKHIEIHYDIKVECTICHGMYKRYNLKYHLKTHTDCIECVECGKKCKDSNYLRYHMTTHTGVKRFQCLYCGKGFANGGQRKIHTRIHLNERPFECTTCHLKFKQSTDLNRHMAVHKTTKNIKCDVCNKTFYHKESLKLHMDIHNNTQRYKCTICEKPLHTRAGLTSHMIRSHTHEKNHHCDICDVSFKTLADIIKHRKLKKHINNEFGFNRKRSLVLKGKFDE